MEKFLLSLFPPFNCMLIFFSVRMLGLWITVCGSKLKATRSSTSILETLSILSDFLRNSLAIVFTWSLLIKSSAFSLSIFFISSFQCLAFHGVQPVSSSQKITPNAQISVLSEYSFFFKDQGAIYKGEPTLYLLYLWASAVLIAKPKSAIFRSSFSVTKILAGLRSRCIICFLAKLRYPARICCMQLQAWCSVRPFLTNLLRSESQSSVTIQVLFLVVKTSQRLRMCGCFLSSLRICISLSRRTRLISFLSMRRSMTLMATFSWVSSFLPRQTWLEQPLPMESLSPQEKFSIFLRVQLLAIAEAQKLLLLIRFNLERQQNYLPYFIQDFRRRLKIIGGKMRKWKGMGRYQLDQQRNYLEGIEDRQFLWFCLDIERREFNKTSPSKLPLAYSLSQSNLILLPINASSFELSSTLKSFFISQ